MDNLIKLPSYEWFIGLMNLGGKGNIYAGSYGTDSYKGCLQAESFRYRVWIDKDENDEKILRAVYYIGNNSYDSTDKEIMTELSFQSSSNGILEAQEKLLSELEKYKNNKG